VSFSILQAQPLLGQILSSHVLPPNTSTQFFLHVPPAAVHSLDRGHFLVRRQAHPSPDSVHHLNEHFWPLLATQGKTQSPSFELHLSDVTQSTCFGILQLHPSFNEQRPASHAKKSSSKQFVAHLPPAAVHCSSGRQIRHLQDELLAHLSVHAWPIPFTVLQFSTHTPSLLLHCLVLLQEFLVLQVRSVSTQRAASQSFNKLFGSQFLSATHLPPLSVH